MPAGRNRQIAVAKSRAGRTFLDKLFDCFAAARKSHSTCNLCQKSGDCSKKAPKRIDIAGVMERRPSTISFTARGGTPIARAMAFWEIFIGLRYSSKRISPGVTGGFMVVTCSVIGVSSMVIQNRNFPWAGIAPSKYNPPLIVHPDRMHSNQSTAQRFKTVSGQDRKVPQSGCPVELKQFSERNA